MAEDKTNPPQQSAQAPAPEISAQDRELLEAAKTGDVERARKAGRGGAHLNARDENKNTPLILAAEKGKSQFALGLIQAGADVRLADKDGVTALHWAAVSGDEPLATALVNKGANVNARSSFASTPLNVAAVNRRESMVDLLLAHGAIPEPEDIKKVASHTSGSILKKMEEASRLTPPPKSASEIAIEEGNTPAPGHRSSILRRLTGRGDEGKGGTGIGTR